MARSPTRRSTEEVKALLTEAALEAFAAGDFERTTTRAIAGRAGVVESVLFRHFPTKNALLAAAVIQPFERFLGDFRAAWESSNERVAAETPGVLIREFIVDLHANLVRRREILRVLIAAAASDPSVAADMGRQLQPIVAALTGISSRYRPGELGGRQSETDIRVILAMVTALVGLEDWFVPGIEYDSLIGDIASLLVGGLSARRIDTHR